MQTKKKTDSLLPETFTEWTAKECNLAKIKVSPKEGETKKKKRW